MSSAKILHSSLWVKNKLGTLICVHLWTTCLTTVFLLRIGMLLTPYHTCPEIWTSLLYYLLICLKTWLCVANSVDLDQISKKKCDIEKKKLHDRYCYNTLVLLNPDMSCLCKQCRSRSVGFLEANWSGSTLFAIQYLNFYQQPGSSYLIGWKLEVGMPS